MPNFGGGPKCPRCSKSVYQAEEILSDGASWHKACHTCCNCKVGLDSLTLNTHEKEIYCKACYTKLFGPKGYGYGQGAGALTHTAGEGRKQRKSPSSARAAAPARPPPVKSTSSAAANTPVNAASTFKPAWAREQEALQQLRSQPIPKVAAGGRFGGGDKCGKCDKTVYHAEKVLGGGMCFHKQCFTCTNCNKGLDSSSVLEHERSLYCAGCHKRLFGPKGVRGGAIGSLAHA